RGYRVSVLACRGWRTASRGFPPGIAGRELRAPVIASMPVHPAFPHWLAKLERESDLLHFHLPFPLAEAAALRLPQRIPWVATLHAEVVGHARPLRWGQRKITRRFLERVTAIVVSSPSGAIAERLRDCPERVHVIPFGFDLRPFLAGSCGGDRGREPPTVLFLG